MDRSSVLYKLRRNFQKIAFDILPKEMLSKIYYRILLGRNLNLDNPMTFNEKLQWYKLYYCANDQLIINCTDKFKVREYITEKGYNSLLTNLIGQWDYVEQIEWDRLPDKFVLKCNHGCAYNIICNDKESFDKDNAKKLLSKWLKEDFSKFNVELHYSKIPPKIICEEFLGDAIVDYKFFCFNGQPEFFYVSKDLINDRQAEMGFFNLDGSKIPLIREDYKDIGELKVSDDLQKMIDISKVLSQDFPFVRVDFFITEDSFKFAELTFTPGAAMMPIKPFSYDLEWGERLSISDLKTKRG